jgi:hypothetical protein
MGSSGGGSGSSDFVTLTIPKKHAQDLVQALNNALGSGGPKNLKSATKVGSSKKK